MTLISIVIPFKVVKNKILFWNQERESSDDLHLKLEFPGGKIEFEETPTEAAVRETFEESGVHLEISDLELFKNYEFSNDLSIFVFLYPDIDERFSSHGYHKKELYLKNLGKIMPNNVVIFEEVSEYLQVVKVNWNT